jgi:hypothetical protein
LWQIPHTAVTRTAIHGPIGRSSAVSGCPGAVRNAFSELITVRPE